MMSGQAATVSNLPSPPDRGPQSWRRTLMDWSKQPSTQQGLSLLLGGCVLAWVHPFPAAEGIAATILAASLPKLWPDNSTDLVRDQALSVALAHAAADRRAADLEPLAEAALGCIPPATAIASAPAQKA